MLRDTLLKALNKYRIFVALKQRDDTDTTINIRRHIDDCEGYLLQGNEINGTWMEENHIILSKAVKHSHDLIHSELVEVTKNDSLEEHQELNKCMHFYKIFYEKNGLDF